MLFVRTTVTLDRDVERMLRESMHKSRSSFKKALNAAVRAGLARRPLGSKAVSFALRARPMGLRPGIDPASLNKLADDLEVESWLSKPKKRS